MRRNGETMLTLMLLELLVIFATVCLALWFTV